ncbi:LuxR C-terminal-related transcriptional regulator [Pseudomonas sp. 13B_2.1_Bac1]|uniref:helix-turn-helix transcriptional regulator n=1 Tax=Pseudomonas sp. 13B_2.1_Bac1 TaxID=2971624 RepID=UPI0021C91386|nr:LuxR family transcriptional regulator [Pseudomonas sp. 13B_2.1_Bac1]MCU1785294.1 LuxR C-terminal-related transcriptional regulator [Pseudomonas sp. 13B_2.1_Bac1]
MCPFDSAIVSALPRHWVDRLFAAMLPGQSETFWLAVAEIVLELLPDDVVVVWETFDTRAFHRGADGTLTVHRGAHAHALRAPAIYTAFNLPFSDSVRTFDSSALANAGWDETLLSAASRPPAAATLDFLQGQEIHATIAIYGHAGMSQIRRQALEKLRPVLPQCVSALFERRRSVAAGAGLAEFLREVPVGLVLVDWFGVVLSVNDEGCRQAAIWNEAPRKVSLKGARQRFAVPDDLTQGWDHLRSEWINWLRGEGARPQALVIKHNADPMLEVAIELVHDHGAPTTTPCFIARFAGIHARGDAGVPIPTPAQIAILSQLSPAERSVALLTQSGLSNQEIADQLGRQVGTVKDHLTSIYEKLGVSRRTQLVKALHLE